MLNWRVMFYLVGIFSTSSPRDSISSNPERTVPWAGRRVRMYRSLPQKAGSPNSRTVLLIKGNQISRVKEFRQSSLTHETGCSGLVHWDDPEGWDGEGGGGGFWMGNTCTSMADSYQCMANPLQYCKVIRFQKINLFKKKNLALFFYVWEDTRVCSLKLSFFFFLI